MDDMMSEVSRDVDNIKTRTKRTKRTKRKNRRNKSKGRNRKKGKKSRSKSKNSRVKNSSRRTSKKLSLEKLINMSHRMRMSPRMRSSPKSQVKQQEPKTPVDSKESIKNHLLNKNFDKKKKYFIMLHVSWCPHCTDALPSFMKAKQILNKDKNICVEEFECEKYPELKKITSGFPTFLEVVKNKMNNYSGPREVNDIVKRCRTM